MTCDRRMSCETYFQVILRRASYATSHFANCDRVVETFNSLLSKLSREMLDSTVKLEISYSFHSRKIYRRYETILSHCFDVSATVPTINIVSFVHLISTFCLARVYANVNIGNVLQATYYTMHYVIRQHDLRSMLLFVREMLDCRATCYFYPARPIKAITGIIG